MVARRHGTTDTLGAPDGPVLVECLSAYYGRGVDAFGYVDIVRGAVGCYGAPEGAPRPGVVGTIRLDDVVLYEGTGGPAVDREIAIAVWRVGARVGDVPAKDV